jgi:tetratricopeptide (TPR) repeat protein
MKRKKKNKNRARTLSVCMIVKDEEKFIGQSLESVRAFADEIVVVDTGSSDNTVEIAQTFGARVFHHPWENSFAMHKNQAIGYATGDWILFIDADEALKQNCGPILKKAVDQIEEEAVFITIISYFNNNASQSRESKVRLFQNSPQIRYQGIVHEQLVGYRSSRTHPVCLFHYGYDLDKTTLKKKSKRTLDLLNKQIADEPDNYWHRHNLAVTHASDFCYKEPIDSAKIALALADKHGQNGPDLLWTYYVLSSSSFKLNDLKAAEKYALASIDRSIHHLDAYFILTLVYHAKKDWDRLQDAAHHYISTLNRINHSPEIVRSMMIHSSGELWRMRLALADLHLHKGREDMAETEFQEALSSTPVKGQCYRVMANIHREHGNLDLAEIYCQNAWDSGDRGAENLLSRAKIQEEQGDQQAYLNTLNIIKKMDIDQVEILAEVGNADLITGLYSDAASVFERIIDISGPEHDALINLALAYKYTDRQDDAIRCNKHALEIQPDSLHALTNLGHLYFETDDVDNAILVYQRALDLEPDALDVSLRLATSYLYQGKANECVALCDLLLEKLQMPRNITLNGKEDLALIFGLIGTGLDNVGSRQLAREAIKVAAELDPAFIENLEKDPHEIQTALNLIKSST